MEISSSIFLIIIVSLIVASIMVFAWQSLVIRDLSKKNKLLSDNIESYLFEIKGLKEHIEYHISENPRILSSVFWESANRLFDQEKIKELDIQNYDFNEFIDHLELYISSLKLENNILSEEKNTVNSQKKSSEVRLGKIGENMAPFFDSWKYDPNNFRFLGSPIDGISFNDDEIVFIEIKTGRSRLSNNQKKVKELINNCAIRFETFRIDENGTTTT